MRLSSLKTRFWKNGKVAVPVAVKVVVRVEVCVVAARDKDHDEVGGGDI